ncbi:Ger(x)C family spore germination protein [Aneurinibacillus sp. REN35]|uniref:Ger(x)C family spore germination protein n=1 Tax=Aneurinibacillus sp. REN35 TaxID=3237286 RepID=UPI003529715F
MRMRIRWSAICILLLLMAGCDRLDVEKTTLSLVYGYDVAEKDKMFIYQLSPVFNKDAKKKFEVYGAKVNTTRQAREVFNSVSNGEIVNGKIQVLLFGEQLLRKTGIMTRLDVIYRDPKNTGNMRVVAVKGRVSSIVNSEFPDKPILPTYITHSIDVARAKNETAFATVQSLHILLLDKGSTPAITEMKADKKGIVVTGSALLDNKGIYKMSLNRRESILLHILQKKEEAPVTLTMQLPSLSIKSKNTVMNKKGAEFVTVNINKIKRTISTHYKKGRFYFDIAMRLDLSLGERTFDVNMEKNQEQLTEIIRSQIEKELNTIVKRVQKHQLDPFNFGWYARAYQYEHWKKIDNRWPHEFAKAEVTITPTVKIKSYGVVE